MSDTPIVMGRSHRYWLQQAIDAKAGRALNAHNQLLRLTYKEVIEATTGVPLSLIEKLQGHEPAVFSGLIQPKARVTGFSYENIMLNFQLSDEATSPTHRSSYYKMTNDTVAQLFSGGMLQLIEAIATANWAMEQESSSAQIKHASPELWDLVKDAGQEKNWTFKEPKTLRNPNNAAMAAYHRARPLSWAFQELIHAPARTAPAVKVGDYMRYF